MDLADTYHNQKEINMISVIVPVFKVEKYLPRCIESILMQSYENLEILLIDDGSPDYSGEICDIYKAKDKRIRVFHIDNSGLSGARNFGLNYAKGEFIGFIDSDDWIDRDMYKALIDTASRYDADVVECGFYDEYPNKSVIKKKHEQLQVYTNDNAVKAHLYGEINSLFMTKLWKRKCFQEICFPTGHVFEDTLIMYKVLEKVNKVIGLNRVMYHHTIRKDSISHSEEMEILIESWLANKNQFNDLRTKKPYCNDKRLMKHLLHNCAGAFSSIWHRFYGCSNTEKKKYRMQMEDIAFFTKQYYPLFGFPSWTLKYRISVFLAHFYNRLSMALSYYLYKSFCHVNKEKMF